MKAIEIISHWEKLKQLIARENIYADQEISMLDYYLKKQVIKELNGQSKD